MLFSNVTTLIMSTARIINPNITATEFKTWYDTVYLPEFMSRHNASLALRYDVDLQSGIQSKWDYLALFRTHEKTSQALKSSDTGWSSNSAPRFGPSDVALELSFWTKIQTFNSLREKRGEVPPGRPNIVMVVKIEPKEGGEEELEDWYRKQVSMPQPQP
jgi:hypothetical protein